MIRTKKFSLTFIYDQDLVDVVIKKKDGVLVAFSVNYRAKINHKWHDVIRYDSAHNVIHVQKFWISPKIIPLRELTAEDMKMAVIEAIDDVKKNWERYKSYMIKKVKKR